MSIASEMPSIHLIPDPGKDWRQKEKRATEDETVGWHHWFSGHELGQTLGDGKGQGSLACCSPWGRKELDMTERLNWTEAKTLSNLACFLRLTLHPPLNQSFQVTNFYWDALCTTLSAGAQKWKHMAPSPQRVQACKWDSCKNQLVWYMLSVLMRNTGL